MEGPRARSRLRNVCVTVYGYENHYDRYIQSLRDDARIKYFVMGKETCPTTGSLHLQGYVEFEDRVEFSTVRSMLLPPWDGIRGDISARRRSAQAASTYCKKDGDFVEHGTLSRQGARTDIENAVDTLRDNIGTKRPMRNVALNHANVFVKYHRGLAALANELVEDREEPPEITVLVGRTGCGKSKKAREMLPQAWIWNPGMDKWFDGYLGHTEAIFEEYRGQLPYASMLSILDRYTHIHQVKGGMCMFVAKKIVITSPMHPRDWYPRQCERTDSIDQLLRRIQGNRATLDEAIINM